MRKITSWLVTAAALAMMTVSANAAVITFEGYAGTGSLVFLPPAYTESGLTFSKNSAELAAIFGPSSAGMIGNSTSSLVWNTSFNAGIVMTGTSPFDLVSVDLGGYVEAPNDKHTNITLTGNLAGGGTLTTTFSNLLSGSTQAVNWTGLDSVVFTGSYYGTMDNIVTGDVNSTPEPGTLLLLSAGIGSLLVVRRRKLSSK